MLNPLLFLNEIVLSYVHHIDQCTRKHTFVRAADNKPLVVTSIVRKTSCCLTNIKSILKVYYISSELDPQDHM